MTAVAVLFVSVMASLLGWGVGEVVDGLSPWVSSMIAAVVALTTSILTTARPTGKVGVSWRRLELIGTVTGSVLFYLVVGGERDGVAVGAVVVSAVLARAIADSTMTDVDLTRRITDDRMGAGPVRRIRTRVISFGLILAALLGYSEASRVGAFDLARPASGRALVPVIVWFGVGMAGVGAVSLWSREWRWQRDGFDIGAHVVDRWISGIAVFVLATMLVAVGLPVVSGGSSALPARGIANAGGVGRWVSEQFERLGDIQADRGDASEPVGEADDAVGDAFDLGSSDPPEWLGDAVVLAVLGSVFLLAVRAGRRASGGTGGPPASSGGWRALLGVVRAVAVEAWRLLGGLLRFLRRLTGSGGDSVARSVASSPRPEGGHGSIWSSNDPGRRRVARAFARIASLVEPRPGETPVDVGVALSDEPVSPAKVVVDAYRLARYSEHPISERWADRVEDAAESVVEHRSQPDLG